MASHAAMTEDTSLLAAISQWLVDIAVAAATWLGFHEPKAPQRDPEWEAAIRRMGQRLNRYYAER